MSFDYTAIIIEPRRHKALQYVLENALHVLADNWKIVLFHGLFNKEYCEAIAGELGNNRIQLIQLYVVNLNQKTYSELLATKSVVYDFINTEYFLVFQTDSLMFKRNTELFTEILDGEYDWVGSPWMVCNYPPTRERDFIGNGGFSLRKTSKMLEIIEKHDWRAVQNTEFEWLEDLFFTKKYSDVSLKKPAYEVAKGFSVDEVFSARTFACHKPWVHSHYSEFVKLYPEVDLLYNLQD